MIEDIEEASVLTLAEESEKVRKKEVEDGWECEWRENGLEGWGSDQPERRLSEQGKEEGNATEQGVLLDRETGGVVDTPENTPTLRAFSIRRSRRVAACHSKVPTQDNCVLGGDERVYCSPVARRRQVGKLYKSNGLLEAVERRGDGGAWKLKEGLGGMEVRLHTKERWAEGSSKGSTAR